MVQGKMRARRLAIAQRRIAAIAVKVGSKTVVEALDVKLLVEAIVPECIHILGSLVAAGAICEGKKMLLAISRGKGFIDAVAHTPVDIAVSSTGEVTTHVGRRVTLRKMSCSTVDGGDDDDTYIEIGNQVSVEKVEGTTIFHFDNLNIYITAQFVHQLNVNPQQVINDLQGELSSLAEAVKQKAEEDEEKNDKKKSQRKDSQKNSNCSQAFTYICNILNISLLSPRYCD